MQKKPVEQQEEKLFVCPVKADECNHRLDFIGGKCPRLTAHRKDNPFFKNRTFYDCPARIPVEPEARRRKA